MSARSITVSSLVVLSCWGSLVAGAPAQETAPTPSGNDVQSAQAEPVQPDLPHVLVAGWRLELVAREPEIVTPIGMAWDGRGRLLVIESHTHKRPAEGYDGPDADRILAWEDTDGDGKLDRRITFHEGGTATLNLVSTPDGTVIVADRSSIYALRDADGDGRADQRQTLVELRTEAVYPHNGLSGLALADDNHLYFGRGENFGEQFDLVGSDGSTIRAAGIGGSVYRCRRDGSRLERIATGMWNPFSICIVPPGRVFVVDNDPDASPPCRLLHVVRGGDFGFQFQFGRAGVHPLQSWDGEFPGTLPMVCGTGEAPSAVVPHLGRLWVTSWGDHTIERYALVPRGASFSGRREVVVQGHTDFRPVGAAVAPDGSLYFGDWVSRSYPVHGQGRIWRLVPESPRPEASPWPAVSPLEARGRAMGESPNLADLGGLDDPFVASQVAWGLSRNGSQALDGFEKADSSADFRERLCLLQACYWRNPQPPPGLIAQALDDPDPDVRLFALRWIAEEQLPGFVPSIAGLLERDGLQAREYLACLATLNFLEYGKVEDNGRGLTTELLVRELETTGRPTRLQALALRQIPPDSEYLSSDRLRGFLNSPDPQLQLEAVRTLCQQSRPDRFAELAAIAGDESYPQVVRLEAVLGLAPAAGTHHDLLAGLAAGADPALANEARRALRLSNPGDHTVAHQLSPDDPAAWLTRIDELPGDVESGRRLFFSGAGPRCGVCHRFAGRGGRVGPDLTHIGRQRPRTQIVESILQPSQEVAPRFVPWILETVDGQVRTGLNVPRGGAGADESFYDNAGHIFLLPSTEIEARMPATTSIMPAGMEKLLTVQDFRDLLALLAPE